MKRWFVSLAAALSTALIAPRAQAKLAAIYASGQGGLQTHGDTGLQLGGELGVRVLLFDGYVDYMGFGSGKSVTRAIVGLRGGLGRGWLRLVLRGGVGAIREQSGALTTPVGATTLTRTGGVLRGGGAVEVRLFPGGWLGVGVDGEAYDFLNSNTLGFSNHGSNLLGVLRLTIELGI